MRELAKAITVSFLAAFLFAAGSPGIACAKELAWEGHLSLAEQAKKAGDTKKAEAEYRLALSEENGMARESLDYAYVSSRLGRALASQERYEEALLSYEEALNVREALLGPVHNLVAASLEDIARIKDKVDRSGEAAELFLRAIEITETLGARPEFIAGMLEEYSEILMNAGRAEEAERALARAFDIRARTEHRPPPEPPK